MKTVHIIPVDKRCDVVLESVKECGKPIQKAYLVFCDDKSCIKDVKNALKNFIEVEEVRVEREVYSALMEILKVIKREVGEGNSVYLNLSDAPRELCIAGVMSAQIANAGVYMAVSNDVIELKVPPIKTIGEDKANLIRVIEENGGEVESINRLIELTEGKIEDHRKYMAQRARMSYHLKGLEEDGLIEMKREGKNVRIRLTPLGRAFAIMLL